MDRMTRSNLNRRPQEALVVLMLGCLYRREDALSFRLLLVTDSYDKRVFYQNI